MNKALSGLLVYRTIMPLAKRLPSNFFEHSPAMFWHYPPIHQSPEGVYLLTCLGFMAAE